MIEINVSQQLKSEIGYERDYDIDEIIDVDGCDRRVWGKVKLTRTDRGILVIGKLKMDITLNCCRCLSEFSQVLSLDIQEEYFPTINVSTGVSVALPEEPGAFTIDEHNILDLGEAIRQYSVMATPAKPLCREDCAGLCPTCGANLNKGPCGCPPQPVDHRWEALRKLAVTDTDK